MKIFSLKMGNREQFEFYARYARLKSLLYINRFNRLASNGGGRGGTFLYDYTTQSSFILKFLKILPRFYRRFFI